MIPDDDTTEEPVSKPMGRMMDEPEESDERGD